MGLRQSDLEFTVDPVFEIDSYKSKMGKCRIDIYRHGRDFLDSTTSQTLCLIHCMTRFLIRLFCFVAGLLSLNSLLWTKVIQAEEKM